MVNLNKENNEPEVEITNEDNDIEDIELEQEEASNKDKIKNS